MKGLWGIAFALASLACQRPDLGRERARVPLGWVTISAPTHGTDAERCANYASDEWSVAITTDGTLTIAPAKPRKTSDTLRIGPDLLVGDDAGEFGGAIWREDRLGVRDTLHVSGRDTTALHTDNLFGFMRRGDRVFALVGLAHLSLDAGELLALTRAPAGRWEARSVLDLRSAPMAVARVADDTILVLTLDSLLSVGLDPIMPTRRVLAGNTVWSGTYGSTLARDRSGVIYIGMRSAVARLTPEGLGYREDWLVRSDCRVRVPGDGNECSCKERTG